jgi:glutathione S-transferase
MNPSNEVVNVYTYILCPYCKPVEYLLKANNIEFVRHELDLMKGEQKSEEYKKINPLQKVPAIIEDDFILFESNTITRYLCNSKNIEDRWYPKNPKKRSNVDLYFDWHAGNASNLFKFTYAKFGWFQNLTLEEGKSTSDAAFQDFERIFLTKSKFLAGDEVSIADLALAWHLKGIITLGYEITERVKTYFDDLVSAEPGLIESLDEYIKVRKERFGM